ncbi:MAG: pyrophosphatase [Bacteroidetes bacterium GWF2_43_63]|nr:MAG: pyrophosphatase [Bacteroidetes bacterium GWE2_42_42]OFY54726.1 MAG: pyrophosphatase [Bacteroidetes bacterium GWF2_43_63]HBG69200.1 pyrophosphatase [Bacteroidales bacterium]HCB62529.1 pyrophosphatase [Bacteroidales bacterium]
MTIEELQEKVDAWIKRHGVRYFSELTNTAILMEEVGELARHMSRQFGEQSYKEGEDPDGLKKEMADVLFVLVCLANQCGVNLEEALVDNLERKAKRDSERHRNNPKLKS